MYKRQDWQVPLRHGLRQPYGENGGPGGLMHTCRQVPAHLAIARDMEALCPAAWLILFSNPLPRLVRAITKYTSIRTVGKCHQINVGYGLVAALLRREYGLEVPADVSLHSDPGNVGVVHSLAAAGRERFIITSAGLNHFIWLLDIRDPVSYTHLPGCFPTTGGCARRWAGRWPALTRRPRPTAGGSPRPCPAPPCGP